MHAREHARIAQSLGHRERGVDLGARGIGVAERLQRHRLGDADAREHRVVR